MKWLRSWLRSWCRHGKRPRDVLRWDEDPVVKLHGWTAGRCGNCGRLHSGGDRELPWPMQ